MRASPANRSAEDFLPEDLSYESLVSSAAGCRGCDLYRNATQTVFGEGGRAGRVMFIGEQPGDEEDKQGHPFVGPAGKLFDRALDDAGIDRESIYLTNAVKHFKWKPRGKRRIHEKPRASEIHACKPWLLAEVLLVRPHIVVCLGATAAQALMGSTFRVTKMRGRWLESEYADKLMATLHPSAVLRMPTPESVERAYQDLVQDLTAIAREMSADPELPVAAR